MGILQKKCVKEEYWMKKEDTALETAFFGVSFYFNAGPLYGIYCSIKYDPCRIFRCSGYGTGAVL